MWSLSRDLSEILVELGVGASVSAADSASLALPQLAGAVDLGPAGEGCLELAGSSRPDHAIVLGDPRGRALAEALEQRGIPTAVLDPRSSNEVLEAVHRLGALMHRETRAAAVAARIAGDVAEIAVRRDGRKRLVAAWLLERDPPVVVGATGLLHELLELAGAENAVHATSGERVTLGAGVQMERTPEVWLDSTGDPSGARDPLLPAGVRLEPVPPELTRLPALDLVERVERLYALLYP